MLLYLAGRSIQDKKKTCYNRHLHFQNGLSILHYFRIKDQNMFTGLVRTHWNYVYYLSPYMKSHLD